MKIVETDSTVERPVTTATTPAVRPVDRTSQVIYLLLGIVEILLGFRFVLLALGANQGAPFVDFIYNLSYPLAAPFYGIFGATPTYGRSIFEPETIVAMIVYAVAAWLIAMAIRAVTGRAPVE